MSRAGRLVDAELTRHAAGDRDLPRARDAGRGRAIRQEIVPEIEIFGAVGDHHVRLAAAAGGDPGDVIWLATEALVSRPRNQLVVSLV